MKTFAVLVLAASGVLSGCVAYDAPGYGYNSGYSSGYNSGAYNTGAYNSGYYRSDGSYVSRDRDGDGVRNMDDRRPDNPYRY